MESLLRWGIEHSAPSDGANHPPPRDISQLDPGIIDQILGKPDAVQMKEALAIAINETEDEDARITALDNFEMLIEQIDNANNITSMNMWEPLLRLLESPVEDIRMNSLWILGTAVQNNPSAQSAFLSYSPIPRLLALLKPASSEPSAVRSKSVYCLSGALRHNRAAVEAFEGQGGWAVLKETLVDADSSIRRKVAFLLNSLLLPDGSTVGQPLTSTTSDIAQSHISAHGIPNLLISALVDPLPTDAEGQSPVADTDYEEKVARTLLSYLETGGRLHKDQAEKLAIGMSKPRSANNWGLAKQEWEDMSRISSQFL